MWTNYNFLCAPPILLMPRRILFIRLMALIPIKCSVSDPIKTLFFNISNWLWNPSDEVLFMYIPTLSCFYFSILLFHVRSSWEFLSGRHFFPRTDIRGTSSVWSLSRLGWFSTAVRDRNCECSVVARTFGPYVGCKCSRLVCDQGVRLGYMAVFVLVSRIAFLHNTYSVEATNLFADAK